MCARRRNRSTKIRVWLLAYYVCIKTGMGSNVFCIKLFSLLPFVYTNLHCAIGCVLTPHFKHIFVSGVRGKINNMKIWRPQGNEYWIYNVYLCITFEHRNFIRWWPLALRKPWWRCNWPHQRHRMNGTTSGGGRHRKRCTCSLRCIFWNVCG